MQESPSKQSRERELHRRLVDGDPTAPADLAEDYLKPLVLWVRRKNPSIDEDLCDEAAHEAILALIRNPTSYQPDKLKPGPYLRMSAQRDLQNLLRKERQHRRQNKSLNLVTLSESDGKYLRKEEPSLVDEPDDMVALVEQQAEGFTEMERKVLDLLRMGVRRTEEYARVCNLTSLSKDEQRREVNRIKNRVKARLKRARRKK